MASGRSCRTIDRGGRAEPFDIELRDDAVIVRRGRAVRALTGADAEAVRAAIDDPERLERVLARKLAR
jgi:hypothetical protein